MKKTIQKSAMAAAGLLILLTATGCTMQPVKAWQRGDLARAEMAFETDPMLSGYRRHIEFSKEAATGGPALSGGGCGCN
ncbi:MAG TPA: DUF4266 domain-containing protein [Solimonas sp.]